MSVVQSLREFISEKLTSAVDEIFTEVEKTIVQYEEVIDRQRRLLDLTWKPQIKLTRTDLSEHPVFNEKEVQTDQRVHIQVKKTCLEQKEHEHRQIKVEQDEPEPPLVGPGPPLVGPGPPLVEAGPPLVGPGPPLVGPGPPLVEAGPPLVEHKQEELCCSRQLQNQDIYNFLVNNSYEKMGHAEPEPEPNISQLPPHSSVPTETPDQEEVMQLDSSVEMPAMRPHNSASLSHDVSGSSGTLFNSDIFGTSFGCKQKARKRPGNVMEHFCPRCGKGFRKMDNMLLHLKTHTGDYEYTCYLCGRGFVHRSGLSCHMKIHTSDRPHSCDFCGKSFTARDALMCHMKVHTANRTNPCKLVNVRGCFST